MTDAIPQAGKPFHLLSDEELESIQTMTWEEVAMRHPAPPWCGDPGNVVHPFGCWSLIGGKIKDDTVCKESCDLYRGGRDAV